MKEEWDMTSLNDLRELRALEVQAHRHSVERDGGVVAWTLQNHHKRLRKLDQAIRNLENAK